MSTISESIRHAALSWPLGYMGDVESCIVNYAFSDRFDCALRVMVGNASVHARTYYLLCAEALEK